MQNQNLVTALCRDLDRGEAETIALALELDAGLVLLDEKEGRHTAQRLGLQVIGVIGILLDARARNVLQLIRPHLDALRQEAGFYINSSLYQRVLAIANEA